MYFLINGAILSVCGCLAPKAEQNREDVRLTICTPDEHFYSIAADSQRLGSTGDNYHDILVTEVQMKEILHIIREKYHLPWQPMTSASPYPPSQAFLLLYGSAPLGADSIQCTIGEPQMAVPILEELIPFLPVTHRARLETTIRKMKEAQQAALCDPTGSVARLVPPPKRRRPFAPGAG